MELSIMQFLYIITILFLGGIITYYFWKKNRKKLITIQLQAVRTLQKKGIVRESIAVVQKPVTMVESEIALVKIDKLDSKPKENLKTSEPELIIKNSENKPASTPVIENLIKVNQLVKKPESKILINITKEPEPLLINLKFVNYDISIAQTINSYPILRFPVRGCIVRSYKIGRTKLRGYKEERFQEAIQDYFGNEFRILGDARINTGSATRAFEPDIAIVELNKGTNLRIDIEIDEPYAGITRQPIHCKGDDINRDNYFLDRGWIVIRFTEHQVHQFEEQCLNYIAQIIKEVVPGYDFSAQYNNQECKIESQWDVVQGQKWEIERYREKYLNHEFQKIEHGVPENFGEALDADEKAEEVTVIDSYSGTIEITSHISYNFDNTHSRDNRIKFYPEPHLYKIDGLPVPSVSTVISKFFPEFDSIKWSSIKARDLGMTATEVQSMWDEKGKKAAGEGHYLHEQIENFFLNKKYERPEGFHLFDCFYKDHNGLKAYRSEWRIFDEHYNVAGTIDFLAKTSDGYEMYDWKRSKKVVNPITGEPIKHNKWQRGIGELNNIDDTSYNRYSLQQSLYKYILEKNYDIKVSKMYLVVLYPEYDNYYKVTVPYLKDEVKHILQSI